MIAWKVGLETNELGRDQEECPASLLAQPYLIVLPHRIFPSSHCASPTKKKEGPAWASLNPNCC